MLGVARTLNDHTNIDERRVNICLNSHHYIFVYMRLPSRFIRISHIRYAPTKTAYRRFLYVVTHILFPRIRAKRLFWCWFAAVLVVTPFKTCLDMRHLRFRVRLCEFFLGNSFIRSRVTRDSSFSVEFYYCENDSLNNWMEFLWPNRAVNTKLSV